MTKNGIEAAIAKLRSEPGKRIELRDDKEAGLLIRAGERGASWSLAVRLQDGQRTRIKLGTWPGMGIAEARAAARVARTQIDQGSNPNERKRVARRTAAIASLNRKTLSEVIEDYDKAVLSQHRRGAQTKRALDGKRGLLRTLLNRQPESIMKAEISDLVKKHAKTAPIAANRNLAYASAFFNWCVDEGVLAENPAEKVRKPSKENERERFHTIGELKEIWAAAGTLGYPFAQLFRLLIVLPNRREEVAAMPVEHLDLASDRAPGDAVWLLPGARTKMNNALRVPLSRLARSIIIEAMEHPDRPKDSKLVFTTTGDTPVSGFTKGRRRLDQAIQAARIKRTGDEETPEMPHWVVHDLRTTFNTHGCEILGIPPHVADRILNHVATATRSKIMRVYNKSELFEPRKEALSAWASLLEQRVIPSSKLVVS
ncbi:site-specific integrase [Sphingobium sp. AR-3-1]|uniref:Site-specific integrase n=1 Tax=Sphingobium psychrophilum TaxID=2728834 RepID=A0A7X9WUR9_9SPHN|nr:site-specific integrase [Sphingobium psychrophilum]